MTAERHPARILVVCTANICRSPMAERLLAEYFARHAPTVDVYVSSAGTIARPGQRAARGMRAVADAWGFELDYHRSRRVDAELVRQQDLIITMEDAHRSVVAQLAPGVGQRTFLITELARLAEAGIDEASERPGLPGAVESWNAMRARRRFDVEDVGDPYGGPVEGYMVTAWELADLVERLGPALVPTLDDR